jgi:hypothetical protein
MTTPQDNEKIGAATERISQADKRLSTMLRDLESTARADKTIVTEVVRAALDDLEAAREALRQLTKPPR